MIVAELIEYLAHCDPTALVSINGRVSGRVQMTSTRPIRDLTPEEDPQVLLGIRKVAHDTSKPSVFDISDMDHESQRRRA